MSAALAETRQMQSRGGAIPSERLRLVVDRYFQPTSNRVDASVARRVFKLRHEAGYVSLDFADRLLVDLGAEHEWHDELADLYPEPPSLRTHAGGIPPRLSPVQVSAAYALYRHGLSLEEIARRIYRRYGFLSAGGCRNSLRRAFRYRGYRMRTAGESLHLIGLQKPCGRCRCEPQKRTRGCSCCTKRHLQWARRGRTHIAFEYEACRGCGCPVAERTPRCLTCSGRHNSWRRQGRPHVVTRCQRCGVPYDERTRGCRSCSQRHSWRRKNGPAPRTENCEPPPQGGAVPPTRKAVV